MGTVCFHIVIAMAESMDSLSKVINTMNHQVQWYNYNRIYNSVRSYFGTV